MSRPSRKKLARIGQRAGPLVLAVALVCCREEIAVEVAAIQIRGAVAIPASEIRAVLTTRASDRLPWGRTRLFDRAEFQADLERIEAYYAQRGYPDAHVSSFDVAFNDARDAVRLTIVIEEGEPIVLEDIRLEGFDALPPDHLQALVESLPARVGSARDTQDLQRSVELATNELKDHGYPYADVVLRERPGPAARRVAVSLAAVPGPVARFGEITIAGHSTVDDRVIRRQLLYHPGERYRISLLQESQRRLLDIELFQFVNVEPMLPADPVVDVPTRVTITEGKHRRVQFGGGYGTEEKLRGEFDFRHVNPFGGAQTLGASGRWSSLSRGVRSEYREPYFFHPSLRFTLSGQRWFEDEPAFTRDTVGGQVTVTRSSVERDPLRRSEVFQSLAATYVHNREDYAIATEALANPTIRDELIALGLDPETGTGGGTLSGLALDFQRNTTGNLLDASQGYVVSGHLESAAKWLQGTFSYLELSGEARYYRTVAEKAVLAARVRAGSIDGVGDDAGRIPFFKRYFLGGSTSLRGWGRYDVSPLTGGRPTGGLTMFESALELRAPIVGNLAGVLFVEGGNVWSAPWDVNLDDLRYDVGPGLRYNTPIGPVRFDLGYQVTPIRGLLIDGRPERRRWRMHFSIGQAF